jgi:hypothetical protein
VRAKTVNILRVELDESLDGAGFRHVETAVGERLGAQRIGASVYQGEPDGPGGAHGFVDGGAWPVLLLETTGLPANICYAGSGEWLMQNVDRG